MYQCNLEIFVSKVFILKLVSYKSHITCLTTLCNEISAKKFQLIKYNNDIHLFFLFFKVENVE